ncbi:MAG TPA: cell envelope integrity protein TolA [Steroidobacteraceae bacterium]|nr:cell envelope integrity protein TolA [Steroidobacteraceae bacterium]
MTERRSDRILSIVLSILIHAGIVGLLLWGWWQYRRPTATPPSLAIEATVVRDAPPQASPPPPNPPPQPDNPPPAEPAHEEQAQQRAREEQAHAEQAARQKAQEQERAAQEKRAADEQAEQRQHEQAQRAAAEKAQAERAAAAKAEAERAAGAKAEADRKAQQLAQQHKLEQERAQREADLRSQLASEEHLNAVQSSPAKAEYLSLITARINRAWIRPSSARPGVKCSLHITQIPGGAITHVVVAGCNGDEAVRQSVETAAYRASPLPAPSDPALFDPNIDVTFAPDE